MHAVLRGIAGAQRFRGALALRIAGSRVHGVHHAEIRFGKRIDRGIFAVDFAGGAHQKARIAPARRFQKVHRTQHIRLHRAHGIAGKGDRVRVRSGMQYVISGQIRIQRKPRIVLHVRKIFNAGEPARRTLRIAAQRDKAQVQMMRPVDRIQRIEHIAPDQPARASHRHGFIRKGRIRKRQSRNIAQLRLEKIALNVHLSSFFANAIP